MNQLTGKEHLTVSKPKKTKKNPTTKVVVLVSLVWIIIGAIVAGFIQHGNTEYNRGISEGMTKAQTLLQSK